MAIVSEIFSAYYKELSALSASTQLFLRDESGTGINSGNDSGAEAEIIIRDLLSRYLPGRFRVVTGYIVDREVCETNKNIPQVDVIVVDKTYPPLARFGSGVEIVCAESVCAVFEIKRSFKNGRSYDPVSEGIEQIANIVKSTGLTKNDNTCTMTDGIGLGNSLSSPCRSNPLVGVIAHRFASDIELIDEEITESDSDACCRLEAKVKEKIAEYSAPLDIIWSLDGFLMTTRTQVENESEDEKSEITTHRVRPEHVSYGHKNHSHYPESALAHFIGFVLSYLTFTTGKPLKPEVVNDYFFKAMHNVIEIAESEQSQNSGGADE